MLILKQGKAKGRRKSEKRRKGKDTKLKKHNNREKKNCELGKWRKKIKRWLTRRNLRVTSENIRNWKRKEEIRILGESNPLNLGLLTVRQAMSY